MKRGPGRPRKKRNNNHAPWGLIAIIFIFVVAGFWWYFQLAPSSPNLPQGVVQSASPPHRLTSYRMTPTESEYNTSVWCTTRDGIPINILNMTAFEILQNQQLLYDEEINRGSVVEDVRVQYPAMLQTSFVNEVEHALENLSSPNFGQVQCGIASIPIQYTLEYYDMNGLNSTLKNTCHIRPQQQQDKLVCRNNGMRAYICDYFFYSNEIKTCAMGIIRSGLR